MPANANLQQLAEIITEAFDFDFDHLFAYYDNFQNRCKAKITIEEDFKEIPIESIFTRKGKKWLFLYDFGDMWYFWLSLVNVFSDDNVQNYPKIIEKKGEAPEQYETFEDKEDLEQEEEINNEDSESLTFPTLDGKVVQVEFIDDEEWQQIERNAQAEMDQKIENNELEYHWGT